MKRTITLIFIAFVITALFLTLLWAGYHGYKTRSGALENLDNKTELYTDDFSGALVEQGRPTDEIKTTALRLNREDPGILGLIVYTNSGRIIYKKAFGENENLNSIIMELPDGTYPPVMDISPIFFQASAVDKRDSNGERLHFVYVYELIGREDLVFVLEICLIAVVVLFVLTLVMILIVNRIKEPDQQKDASLYQSRHNNSNQKTQPKKQETALQEDSPDMSDDFPEDDSLSDFSENDGQDDDLDDFLSSLDDESPADDGGMDDFDMGDLDSGGMDDEPAEEPTAEAGDDDFDLPDDDDEFDMDDMDLGLDDMEDEPMDEPAAEAEPEAADDAFEDGDFDLPDESEDEDLDLGDLDLGDEPDDAGEEPAAEEQQSLYSPRSGLGWASFLEERLDGELERSTSNNEDLVLILFQDENISGDSEYRELAERIKEAFPHTDMDFEFNDKGFAVIEQGKDLDDGIGEIEELLLDWYKLSTGSTTRAGLSSRNGRMVDADRLLREARSALEKTSRENPIVAFRPDPDKYRDFMSRQDD